jgi:predicted small secreted protein
MKILHNILALLVLAMVFTACNSGAPEGEKVEAGEKVEKAEDTSAAESYARRHRSKPNQLGRS